MKFRKVREDGNADGTKGWTVATASTSSGCAVKVKSHRRLPLSIEKGEHKNYDDEQHDPKSDDNLLGDNSKKDREIMEIEEEDKVHNEIQIPVTPKARDIQYTVEDRRAPPKVVIEHFYNMAVVNRGEEKDGAVSSPGAQKELNQASLLSLEDILLPAIAHQENLALKQIQRKVQRDAPDQTHIVQAGRLAVTDCLAGALRVVRQSRLERRMLEQEREETWAKERQAKRVEERQKRKEDLDRQRTEEIKLKEMKLSREKRELKKKLPFNQDLWREVAFLMTESAKLAKEERLWKEAEEVLAIREDEVETKEASKLLEKEDSEKSVIENETESQTELVMRPVDESMADIIHSSQKIQSALQMVSDLLVDSSRLRKDVYHKYRQDHQFQGYRGVNDPKGLVRILSQDTET